MTVHTIFTLFLLAVLAVPALLIRFPPLRRQYLRMDNERLAEANQQARSLRYGMLAGAAVFAVFSAFIYVKGCGSREPAGRLAAQMLLVLLLFVSTIAASLAWFYREVFSLTGAEIDDRIHEKQDDNTIEQSPPHLPRARGGHSG